jgi:outer membrane lipoprotein-sorting protein
MKFYRKISIGISILALTAAVNLSAQDAATILNKMDNIALAPKDRQGKVTMILTDKAGKEKIREAMMFQKGADKKLYRYTKPESQAGIATLTLPGNVMWLYMPAFEKPRKISMLTKDSAFNNTDFSYEDMATTPFAERFVPELVETRQDSYILKLTPKAAKSNYSKVIVTISRVNGYAEFMEFYDTNGKKFKEATYRYEKIGPYWNPAEVIMKDLEKSHSTKILITETKFDQGLPDDLFLVENIKPADKKKPDQQNK